MIKWYNREGREIPIEEANALLGDFNYKRVAYDEVPGYEVSTVWLGLDHNWSRNGPPLIFETMIFPLGTSMDVDCDRYSTEAEAIAGHKRMVKVARRLTPLTRRCWMRLRGVKWKRSN